MKGIEELFHSGGCDLFIYMINALVIYDVFKEGDRIISNSVILRNTSQCFVA